MKKKELLPTKKEWLSFLKFNRYIQIELIINSEDYDEAVKISKENLKKTDKFIKKTLKFTKKISNETSKKRKTTKSNS